MIRILTQKQLLEITGFNALQAQVTHEAFHDALARPYFPRCQGGAHAAPLNDIINWINAPTDSKAPIMWLNGKPNTGSSTVAQTIADKCADAKLLLASFFFSGSGDTETRSLFPTIAYQIAIKILPLRSTIGRAVANDPLIFERNLDIQMQSLIMEPLITANFDLSTFPRLVIIDGLDNISSQMQHRIISILAYSLRKYDFPLMFLISSIQQDSITDAFSRYLEMVEQSNTGTNSNRLSFHNLSIKSPRQSSNPIVIQTSLPADAHSTAHSTTRSPILLRSPTTGRIPIVDHSIRTKLNQYKRPPYRLENSFNITCVKLSPDDHMLLVGTANGTLRVWDATHGRIKTEHHFSSSQTGMVIDVAYSSSSYLKYAVVLQDPTSPTTSIYAVLNDKKLTSIKVENELPPLSHVYALSNGTIVAPYYIQGRVFLKSWKMRKLGAGGVSWDKGMTLSDLAGLRNHYSSPDTFSGCAFSVSSDQKTFWTATKLGSVFSSKLENGHQVAEALQLPSYNPRPASGSSAQTYSGYPNIPIASTSSQHTSYGLDLAPSQANLGHRPATIIPIYSSNSVPAHYYISPGSHSGSQVCLACSPDQRKLAVSLASGEIFLWDISLRVVKAMREAKATMPPTLGASPITFSTDSKYIIYACNDLEKSIKIQDIATTTISDSVLLQECPDNNEITYISVAKDFKYIIVSFRQCSYSLLFKWP